MCYSLLGEGKNVAFPTNEGSNEWNRVEYLLNLFIINLQLFDQINYNPIYERVEAAIECTLTNYCHGLCLIFN